MFLEVNNNNHFKVSNLLAEQRHSTNWQGGLNHINHNEIKSNVGFGGRWENQSTQRKTSRSKVEKQQSQPTYDAGSGNRTRATLVEGERYHHSPPLCKPPASVLKSLSVLANLCQ